MKRGERPHLVLVPDPDGERRGGGPIEAPAGGVPLRNASPAATGGPDVRENPPEALAAAAEALAALLRGLAPSGPVDAARGVRGKDPSR
jgi:hypothetical protein